HPGPCTTTAFDIRSLYVRLPEATAEVFGDEQCKFDRDSPVVSATAPQAPGASDINTGKPMRSIDIYRNH
ncbi:MAG TPA: hypothetical protein VFE65_34040, partial [Pseudonocardia sp.]|nr:hypothetical protein [Pseudonocardia sp.]